MALVVTLSALADSWPTFISKTDTSATLSIFERFSAYASASSSEVGSWPARLIIFPWPQPWFWPTHTTLVHQWPTVEPHVHHALGWWFCFYLGDRCFIPLTFSLAAVTSPVISAAGLGTGAAGADAIGF